MLSYENVSLIASMIAYQKFRQKNENQSLSKLELINGKESQAGIMIFKHQGQRKLEKLQDPLYCTKKKLAKKK
jgi:hypothetical protein